LALDHGLDTDGVGKNKYGGGVNAETNLLAQEGVDLQQKSKEALMRTLGKVNDTNALANEAAANLEKQNEQILRISDKVQKLEGTMLRTKKHLRYFGKSFCADKTALSLCFLIVLTLAAIIIVSLLDPVVPPVEPVKPEIDSDAVPVIPEEPGPEIDPGSNQKEVETDPQNQAIIKVLF